MDPELFVSRVLDDEGITNGLDEPEAQRLTTWLVQQVEKVVSTSASEDAAWQEVEKLCKRGRAMRELVVLWCQKHDATAAARLAAAERLPWPLSPETTAPAAVLQQILDREKN